MVLHVFIYVAMRWLDKLFINVYDVHTVICQISVMLCLFVPDTSGRLCLTFLTFHIYIFSLYRTLLLSTVGMYLCSFYVYVPRQCWVSQVIFVTFTPRLSPGGML